MIKSALFVVAAFVAGVAVAVPHIRVARQTDVETELGLPSNSTSIRANIVNTFTCDNKIYGYYADVDNECQVFHVCMPVVYADGKQDVLKWSFICPEETIFDQANLVCSRPEDAIPCEESANYLNVNENFGKIPEKN